MLPFLHSIMWPIIRHDKPELATFTLCVNKPILWFLDWRVKLAGSHGPMVFIQRIERFRYLRPLMGKTPISFDYLRVEGIPQALLRDDLI